MTLGPDWRDVASLDGEAMALADGAVDCWLFSLERAADLSLLDDGERDRAARFVFDRDRRRFIAGRDARRRILARYVGTPAARLQFREGPQGRPSLADGAVNFNMSRSGAAALLAVSRAGALGVDLEAVVARDDLAAVARQNFSPAERAALAALPDRRWTDGFFNAWTRKEAVVKALGYGLHAPLDAFDVALAPDAAPAILRAEGPVAAAADWTLTAFDTPAGARAALIVDLAAPNLQLIRVMDEAATAG